MGVVPVLVGIVLDDEAYLTLVRGHHFFYGRTGRHAVWSLEIEEFYNGHGRAGRSQGRRIFERDGESLLVCESRESDQNHCDEQSEFFHQAISFGRYRK